MSEEASSSVRKQVYQREKEKAMSINDKIGKYEENLRKAEKDIEAAARAVCSLRGVNTYQALKALENVQEALRGVWQYYDNPSITEA